MAQKDTTRVTQFTLMTYDWDAENKQETQVRINRMDGQKAFNWIMTISVWLQVDYRSSRKDIWRLMIEDEGSEFSEGEQHREIAR